jgi:hypothetical protein
MDSKLIEICYKKYNKEITTSWSELAETWGYISGEALRSKFKKYRKSVGDIDKNIITEEIENIPNYKSSTELKNDGSQVSDKLISMSENESKDPEFILKSHGYNPKLFSLISAKNSIWNVNTKNDGIKVLYSSRIAVKPKTEYLWNEEDIKNIFSNLKTNKNKIDIQPLQYKQNGKLLIFAPSDFHYNLLSEQLATGNEYNLEIAENIFYYILNDLINRVKDNNFEKVLFILGNDFMNADNLNGTTNHNTPQDNCSNWFSVINKATQLIIDGIDTLTNIAPVDIVYVPSNHDTHSMFGIMQTINAYYRNDNNVSVDCSPLPRKYYKFGSTLLALSHDMKVKDALQIITSEAKSLWSNCKHIVCFLAHLHQSMIYEKQGYLEIMRLPCVSGFSRWSNDKGYIQVEKKNQSFIVDNNDGIVDIMNTVIDD